MSFAAAKTLAMSDRDRDREQGGEKSRGRSREKNRGNSREKNRGRSSDKKERPSTATVDAGNGRSRRFNTVDFPHIGRSASMT